MMRQTTASNAAQATMMLNGTGVPTMLLRPSAGNFPLSMTASSVATPYWVRLYRLGGTITGYISADGLAWTSVMTYPNTLSGTIELVLFATSSATNGQATLDNITINGLAPRFAQEASLEELEVRVFPNPVKETLNINLTTPTLDQVYLSLYNTLGQQVLTQQFEANGLTQRSVPMHDLPTGVYMLLVKAGVQTKTIKIRKN